MQIVKELLGKNEFGNIYKYDVIDEGIRVSLCEMGASVMSVILNGRDGDPRDIILGQAGMDGYKNNWPAFGAVIGRFANRINKAVFRLNGKKYKLKKNISGGCLHSGFGYHLRKWKSDAYEENGIAHVVFRMKSYDGDQGFPGNLDVSVDYGIGKDYFEINYDYKSDAETPVNLTNHAYFNLDGHDSGSVLQHRLFIDADNVTQLNKKMIPTGKILHVKGSAFDFRKMMTIEENAKKEFKPYSRENEYDINYILNKGEDEYKMIARLESEKSGLGMKVYTDMPGMQFYTANAIYKMMGKDGKRYEKYPGVCFETQYYPDSVNIKSFPSPFIKKDVPVRKKTRFEFYNF